MSTPSAGRYRHAESARHFPDKQGGWTLVTPAGERLRLRNRSSRILWQAMMEEGASEGQLIDRLCEHFPDTSPTTVAADVRAFLRHLVGLGFVRIRR